MLNLMIYTICLNKTAFKKVLYGFGKVSYYQLLKTFIVVKELSTCAFSDNKESHMLIGSLKLTCY